MDIISIIGRKFNLFSSDIESYKTELSEKLKRSRVLVIGAAGSIGQAVTTELFKRDPKTLHAVDLNENNLVELVRSLRSQIGYISGEFKTFSIDCKSVEFSALCKSEKYDYIFNLSAMKHVRSEKDPYTLMRMIDVNIFNAVNISDLAKLQGAKNYFTVSTDKATNPVNIMGASKLIMEHFLLMHSESQNISMARFANVAFSDGSLLYGFNQRFLKRQPITAPIDVKRYFISPTEAGELCLLSGLCGQNRDVFFPKLDSDLHLESFSRIAVRFLESKGFSPVQCESEEEARFRMQECFTKKKWPVYFFSSDTTGEKGFEEFFTNQEEIDLTKFHDIGIIKKRPLVCPDKLNEFSMGIKKLRNSEVWTKQDLLNLIKEALPNFDHYETNKYLDDRM